MTNPPDLDHVALVVADASETEATFARLGFSVAYRERIREQGVDVVGLRAGNAIIELLTPLDPNSPIARFLGTHRARLHHVAYRVADIRAELARLKDSGVPLIDEHPRRGAHGNRIAFIHPSYTGGTLIELCQPAGLDSDTPS